VRSFESGAHARRLIRKEHRADIDTEQASPSHSPAVAPSVNLSLEELAGTYSNPGYGEPLTFCAPSDTSDACAAVLSNFTATSGGALDAHTLYAAWPRVWSTHVALSRRNGSASFDFHPLALFPGGYGRNSTPFAGLFDQDARAEFGLSEDGQVLGLGVVFPEWPESYDAEGTPRERAEAWFVRH
jgi:hypothetical protein